MMSWTWIMSMLLRPLVCWTTALLQSSGTPCDVTASLSPSLISRCEHSPLTAHLIHNYLYLSRKLLSLSSCITSSFELVINGFFYVIFCYLAYTALLSWSFLSINNIGYFTDAYIARSLLSCGVRALVTLVSKWPNLPSNFFHHLVAPSF